MNLFIADNNANLVSFRVHHRKDLSSNEEEKCGRDDLALADRANRPDVRTSRPSSNPQEAKERAPSNPDSGHLIADDGQYGSRDRIMRANDNGGELTADSRIMEPAFETGRAGRSGEKRRNWTRLVMILCLSAHARRSSNSSFAISSPHISDRGRHEFHRTESTSQPRIRRRRCRLAETGADDSSSNEEEKSEIGNARGSAGDSSFPPQVDRMDTSSPTSRYVHRRILDCRTRDRMLEIKVLWPRAISMGTSKRILAVRSCQGSYRTETKRSCGGKKRWEGVWKAREMMRGGYPLNNRFSLLIPLPPTSSTLSLSRNSTLRLRQNCSNQWFAGMSSHKVVNGKPKDTYS
jgi:hypothetical protein